MKAITLALTLGLFAVHAQAAEATPAPSAADVALGLELILTFVGLAGLTLYCLFRGRAWFTDPKRRLAGWVAAFTAGPALLAKAFGLTGLFLLPALVTVIPPAIVLSVIPGHSPDELKPVGDLVCAAVGWVLIGALLASFRTRLLNRREKRAAELLAKLPAE